MPKQEELSLNETIVLNPVSINSTNSFVKISSNIFTVFVGLVASGYEFSYDQELAEKIRSINWDVSIPLYFSKARTSYCEVYPYWPKAAMLVTAAKDVSSWYRVFEENLVRASTIWVNETNLKEAERKALDLGKEGFLYVPELLNQLHHNWHSIVQFDNFIEGCLAACQHKYNSIASA
jgi:hypothetical protein